MPSISTTEIGRRRAVARFVAAFATALLVLSALVLSAEAHADPDPNAPPAIDPKAQCESLDVGGVFVTDVQNGIPRSVCQYIVEGYFYYDTFENGTYLGTSVYKDGATRPTQRPDIPEVFGPVSRPMPPFS